MLSSTKHCIALYDTTFKPHTQYSTSVYEHFPHYILELFWQKYLHVKHTSTSLTFMQMQHEYLPVVFDRSLHGKFAKIVHTLYASSRC